MSAYNDDNETVPPPNNANREPKQEESPVAVQFRPALAAASCCCGEDHDHEHEQGTSDVNPNVPNIEKDVKQEDNEEANDEPNPMPSQPTSLLAENVESESCYPSVSLEGQQISSESSQVGAVANSSVDMTTQHKTAGHNISTISRKRPLNDVTQIDQSMKKTCDQTEPALDEHQPTVPSEDISVTAASSSTKMSQSIAPISVVVPDQPAGGSDGSVLSPDGTPSGVFPSIVIASPIIQNVHTAENSAGNSASTESSHNESDADSTNGQEHDDENESEDTETAENGMDSTDGQVATRDLAVTLTGLIQFGTGKPSVFPPEIPHSSVSDATGTAVITTHSLSLNKPYVQLPRPASSSSSTSEDGDLLAGWPEGAGLSGEEIRNMDECRMVRDLRVLWTNNFEPHELDSMWGRRQIVPYFIRNCHPQLPIPVSVRHDLVTLACAPQDLWAFVSDMLEQIECGMIVVGDRRFSMVRPSIVAALRMSYGRDRPRTFHLMGEWLLQPRHSKWCGSSLKKHLRATRKQHFEDIEMRLESGDDVSCYERFKLASYRMRETERRRQLWHWGKVLHTLKESFSAIHDDIVLKVDNNYKFGAMIDVSNVLDWDSCLSVIVRDLDWAVLYPFNITLINGLRSDENGEEAERTADHTTLFSPENCHEFKIYERGASDAETGLFFCKRGLHVPPSENDQKMHSINDVMDAFSKFNDIMADVLYFVGNREYATTTRYMAGQQGH